MSNNYKSMISKTTTCQKISSLHKIGDCENHQPTQNSNVYCMKITSLHKIMGRNGLLKDDK